MLGNPRHAMSGFELVRILDIDIDAYLGPLVGVYEESKRRWEECSPEEWAAVADGDILSTSLQRLHPLNILLIELISDFTKLLDMVRLAFHFTVAVIRYLFFHRLRITWCMHLLLISQGMLLCISFANIRRHLHEYRSKARLFAKLDRTISIHKNKLESRARMLDDKREELVKYGGGIGGI
jgi:hypothetical protein